MAPGKVQQSEPGLDLKARVIEYLKHQGYEVTEAARLQGKSGVEHTLDMLAQKDDGFMTYNIAIGTITETDREAQLSTIFDLANKAYDSAIQDRAVLTLTDLSQEAREFAQKQRIKVFDGKQIPAVADLEPLPTTKTSEPFRFETKSQLLESLTDRGYRVEEKAKVRGRSGVSFTFDILAYGDDGQIGHSLGIDILSGEEEITLGQVTLFDTKAYDVGVDNKTIVASPKLNQEAKQFAQHQRIKVLELGNRPLTEFLDVAPQIIQVEEKPDKPGGKPPAKPQKLSPQPEALQLIPEVMARRYNAIPLTISGNTLQVAMADPSDIFALEAFSAQSQKRIKPFTASSKEVRDAIDLSYKGYGDIERQISGISASSQQADDRLTFDTAVDAPIAKALTLIIDEAVKARSSDIHLEPDESRLRVRYRIDGTLQDTISLPLNIHAALVSRVKILADMNIADHHRPQDGQFSTKAKGREIDVRVATAPTVNGEMAVMRLLDKSLALIEMSELGLLPENLATYEALLRIPYGMILISGPTGAGKTTTLYASINSLDMIEKNIITIEDPAEYRFKDINQIQVNPQAGITFASGLRSILRLDPDVIMVGEIRDSETADIAVQASLTGHLMLSSIHANDATGVLFRLLDLKVEPFLIASAVIGIVAQRMVRRVCPYCSHLIEAPVVEQLAYEQEMGEKKTEFLYGTGCKLCSYTGHQGRVGIFEILRISDELRMMMTRNANTSDIRHQALKEGMTSIMNDGMHKVQAGVTTPSEVLRVSYSTV
ncbi:ATPase, T2SS/T4P/T4SS family [Chloroflexota bacterium]